MELAILVDPSLFISYILTLPRSREDHFKLILVILIIALIKNIDLKLEVASSFISNNFIASVYERIYKALLMLNAAVA